MSGPIQCWTDFLARDPARVASRLRISRESVRCWIIRKKLPRGKNRDNLIDLAKTDLSPEDLGVFMESLARAYLGGKQ